MSSTLTHTPPAAAYDPGQRAARVLLFLGVLEIVVFGLLTFALLRAANTSVSDLQQITGANLTRDQLEAVHPHLKSFAAILALSGLVPGAIYILCSLAIKQGRLIPRQIALVFVATQFFILGGILIRQLLVAIGQGDPPAMTYNVLALGTPMTLLVLVMKSLLNRPGLAGEDPNLKSQTSNFKQNPS